MFALVNKNDFICFMLCFFVFRGFNFRRGCKVVRSSAFVRFSRVGWGWRFGIVEFVLGVSR